METYFDLLDKIKYFSGTNFKGVYSRPFFKHVISNCYNPETDNFSVIYCDFNRLNDINQAYSEKVGDMLIQNTYSAIYEILNEYFNNTDFSISKFGGDEFLIIIGSCDREMLSGCFNDIYSKLQSSSIDTVDNAEQIPDFVNFSSGIVCSDEKEFNSIYEMINTAEHKQLINKLSSNTLGPDFEENLTTMINNSIDRFFRNFRLNDYLDFDVKNSVDYSVRDIKSLISSLINSTIKLLAETDKIEELEAKLTELIPLSNMSFSTHFTESQSREMYDSIRSPELREKHLIECDEKDLYSFLDILIREPVSGLYNQSYFFNYFLNDFAKSGDTFSTAIIVDTLYMKDSNFRIGRDATDTKMKLIADDLQSELESRLNRAFDSSNFGINSNTNYIFDLGGGNYFILSRDNLSIDAMDEITHSISKDCKPLGLAYSMENIENRKDIRNILNSLYKNCNAKKYSFKSKTLDFSAENVTDAFYMFLAPTLRYYLQNNPNNPLHIKELRSLVNSISNSIILQTSKHFRNTSKDSNNKYHDNLIME